MLLYKLTDEKHQTHGGTQWGPGVSHSGTGEGTLCGPGCIHAYLTSELAVLLNPVHENFKEYVLWEAEGEIALNDHDLRVGCRTLTTLRAIPAPVATAEMRVAFAIRCALAVCDEPSFSAWARNWLSGKDRSRETARGAAVCAGEVGEADR